MDKDEVRLVVGMTVYDSVMAETMISMFVALRQLTCPVQLNVCKGTIISNMRNEIIQTSIETGATHVMFVDSDIIFPPDAIATLLTRGKDIIGGMYNNKTLPLTTTIKVLGPDGNILEGTNNFQIPAEPFKCFAVPAGFMLIRLEAIKDMKNPFDFGRTAQGDFIGEDINFCERAQKELGLEVWCDPTFRLGHIGPYVY
jgi:hypothetical protein